MAKNSSGFAPSEFFARNGNIKHNFDVASAEKRAAVHFLKPKQPFDERKLAGFDKCRKSDIKNNSQ